MSDEGGGAGGKGRMRDNSDIGRGGGGDIGRHPCDARPLGGSKTRGGLGISPH